MENPKIFDFTTDKDFAYLWDNRPYKSYNGILLPDAQISSLHGGFGDMVFQKVGRPNYDLWFSVYQIRQRVRSHCRADLLMTELSLLIKNNVSYTMQPPFGHIHQRQWQFNLMHANAMDSKVQFEKDVSYTTMDFHPKLALIEALYEQYPALVEPYLNAIRTRKEMLFYSRHLYTTLEMTQTVEMIFQIISKPQINTYLLDLCVSLLFAFAVTCKLDMHSKNFRYDYKQELKLRLGNLLNVVLSDLQHFYGIKKYAVKAGMSPTALKNNIKNVYDTTLKEMWAKERMLHCFDRVVHSNESFDSIASEFGFSDGAAFSTAFKKRYQFPPSYFRKSIGGENE